MGLHVVGLHVSSYERDVIMTATEQCGLNLVSRVGFAVIRMERAARGKRWHVGVALQWN